MQNSALRQELEVAIHVVRVVDEVLEALPDTEIELGPLSRVGVGPQPASMCPIFPGRCLSEKAERARISVRDLSSALKDIEARLTKMRNQIS